MSATKPNGAASGVTEPGGAYRILVDGAWVAGKGPVRAVNDKYRLQPGAQLTTADARQVRQA